MSRSKLIFALAIATVCATAPAAGLTDIEANVAKLNGQTVNLVGVSLNALRYLVSAAPNIYLLLWRVEGTNDIKYIRELEAKGYVKTQVVEGLPDGTQMNERFLRVIPIGDGLELQRCVLAFQGSAAQQTPGPTIRVVAAGTIHGLDVQDLTLGGLRATRIDDGEIQITFEGYSPPDSKHSYIVKVLSTHTGQIIVPTVEFDKFEDSGLSLRVLSSSKDAKASDIRRMAIMVEIAELRK